MDSKYFSPVFFINSDVEAKKTGSTPDLTKVSEQNLLNQTLLTCLLDLSYCSNEMAPASLCEVPNSSCIPPEFCAGIDSGIWPVAR